MKKIVSTLLVSMFLLSATLFAGDHPVDNYDDNSDHWIVCDIIGHVLD